MCIRDRGKPVIPICQPGQVIQVKNVLKSFLRNKLVKLLFPPVVVTNKRDLKKMFQRLQDLSLEYGEDVNEEDNDDEAIHTKSRSYCRNKKAENSKKKSPKSNKKPKRKKQKFFTSWFTWGISITIGISFGCCVTYFVTAAYEHQTVKSLSLRPSISVSYTHLDVYKRQPFEWVVLEILLKWDDLFQYQIYSFSNSHKSPLE